MQALIRPRLCSSLDFYAGASVLNRDFSLMVVLAVFK